uniref:Uncharacterized protein n=1 Tax=Aegilops tauschii subsp. strangulata TaxID=200361 RepID=A0A453BRI4_AEGTS
RSPRSILSSPATPNPAPPPISTPPNPAPAPPATSSPTPPLPGRHPLLHTRRRPPPSTPPSPSLHTETLDRRHGHLSLASPLSLSPVAALTTSTSSATTTMASTSPSLPGWRSTQFLSLPRFLSNPATSRLPPPPATSLPSS